MVTTTNATPTPMSRRCVGRGSASAALGTNLSAADNPMLHPYSQARERVHKPKYRIYSRGAHLRLCGEPSAAAPASSASAGGASRVGCDSGAAQLAEAGVRLLIGVLATPRNRLARSAIRQSWMRWEGVGTRTLVCFVIGRASLEAKLLASLDEEAAASRDILWLPHAADGCYLTLSKIHDFWVAAAALRVPHAAKVDEDSFVHLPNLEAELRRLSCVERLYYGAGATAGYHPTRYAMCGFSWRGDSAYRRYGCAQGGARPPFPFVMGGLQVLSAPLAAHLAGSRAVREFVARSDGLVDYARLAGVGLSRGGTVNDDVVMGLWLSDAQQRGLVGNVSYVFINERAKNIECDMRDCLKRRACSLYGVPSNGSVLIHNLKAAAMQTYAWAVVRGHAMHDAHACKAFFAAPDRHASRALEAVRRWIANPAGSAHGRFRSARGPPAVASLS